MVLNNLLQTYLKMVQKGKLNSSSKGDLVGSKIANKITRPQELHSETLESETEILRER